MKTGDIPKDCTTCAFKCMANKGATPYCVLKRFPILNPEIGCSRHMTKGEIISKNGYITAEEIAAAAEAVFREEENIGGYSIGHVYLGADKFDGYGPGLGAMMRIMDVVGADRWEDLKDHYIRVESNGWGGAIKKIGHITEDHWFDINDFFKSKAKEHKNETP